MDLKVDGGGLEDYVFSFRSSGTTVTPDRIRDGRPKTAGMTVVHGGVTGEYLVTLPKVGGGYPAQVVGIIPSLAFLDIAAAVTGVGVEVFYKADSYSASAGTFRLIAIRDDGTPAGEDLADNIEVHVHARFQRSNLMKQA
jgi:hypothetical protein